MKRVLFVSVAFPPKNDPECLQAARYFKYMVKGGIPVSVVTSALPTLYMPYDSSLEQYNYRETPKISIPIFETKISNYLWRKMSPTGINFPDPKFSFYWQWRRVVRQITTPPEILYSRSNPISSALMALRLQQYYNVPWVMHLSDPWVGSPVVHYTKQEQQFNERWEKLCFDNATRVSFTTAETLDFYVARYPGLAQKFFLSPNVFDHEAFSAEPLDLHKPLRIVYTGGLAGGRSPEFFLTACSRVVKKDSRLAKSEIVFAGPIDRRNSKILEQSGLPFVRHAGQLSYQEALKLQQSAHLLLAIDQALQDGEKSMFFPSKILDYFVAGRKILALTNRDSATASILSTVNAAVIQYPDLDELERFLLAAIDAFHRHDVDFFRRDQIPSEFSAEANAGKLIQILQSL